MPTPLHDPQRTDQAPFNHFSAHRAMVRAYLHAILHDQDLVDDTLSDVSVEVARCWGVYDPTMPFGPWVRGIARRLALKRLRRRRRITMGLPDDVIESLGVVMDQLSDVMALDAQKRQLRQCLEGLTERNRELVRLRYFEDQRLDTIAAISKRSLGALYVAFSRIHAALLRCMEQVVAKGRQ